MPKFKPKAILSRVLLGESSQNKDGLDYLCAGFDRNLLGPFIGRYTDDIVDDDDGSSIISISTTATFDNLPGTGRLIDTHIFQPLGRRIERLAMRFTIASLHPARITQYIEAGNYSLYPGFNDSMTLHDAIARLCSSRRNGSTAAAGLKGLVKQTKSNSIHRASFALAALIRVSLTLNFRVIYANVSRIEPIFHLETLIRSHPDKKWFLLLVKLARETLIAIRAPSHQKCLDPFLRKEVLQLWPSPEVALNLRQRLIRMLKVYRCSGVVSLDDTIGEACAICAVAVSTCINIYARGDAYLHSLETVYFTVVFLYRLIHELADFARFAANTHIHLVLRTIACWMDAIVYNCVFASHTFCGIYNMDRLKMRIAFQSLVLVDGGILLPETFNDKRWEVFRKDALPRRHREAAKRGEDTPPIQRLIEAAKQRTLRLLRSFNELENQVWECASRTNISTSQLDIVAHPNWYDTYEFGCKWWEHWKNTHERARKVLVSETVLTEEFREARRLGLEYGVKFLYESWAAYQTRRLTRHKWGQYFRSDMDWDWDLGECMRRLFKIEQQTRVGPSAVVQISPTSSPTIDMGAVPGPTWSIMTEEVHGSLPKEVKIAYKTETGETQYVSFTPASPSPGNLPVSDISSAHNAAEERLEPKAVQQELGYRKASSGAKQEIVDLETIASSPGGSQSNACEDRPVEDSDDGCKGKGPVYDGGYDEVQASEDTISICSLD